MYIADCTVSQKMATFKDAFVTCRCVCCSRFDGFKHCDHNECLVENAFKDLLMDGLIKISEEVVPESQNQSNRLASKRGFADKEFLKGLTYFNLAYNMHTVESYALSSYVRNCFRIENDKRRDEEAVAAKLAAGISAELDAISDLEKEAKSRKVKELTVAEMKTMSQDEISEARNRYMKWAKVTPPPGKKFNGVWGCHFATYSWPYPVFSDIKSLPCLSEVKYQSKHSFRPTDMKWLADIGKECGCDFCLDKINKIDIWSRKKAYIESFYNSPDMVTSLIKETGIIQAKDASPDITQFTGFGSMQF